MSNRSRDTRAAHFVMDNNNQRGSWRKAEMPFGVLLKNEKDCTFSKQRQSDNALKVSRHPFHSSPFQVFPILCSFEVDQVPSDSVDVILENFAKLHENHDYKFCGRKPNENEKSMYSRKQ